MIKLKYDNGYEKNPTMTVGELKAKLDQFPDHYPVFATWEGVMAPIQPQNIGVETIQRTGGVQALVINVDEY